MKHYRKLLSLLLIICISMTMLTGYIPVNAVAPATETPLESITPFELPDIVDTAEAEEKGYIGRIKTEEKDLYTFVFANEDGTNTMRVYSHPVKYVAKDGTVRDISLDVKAKADGGFVTADHEIITTFEKTLTDGISLAYDDVEVTLIPKLGLGKVPAATLDSNNKVVTYKMNDVTSFVYELTYAGFKEDIVVKEYTGQTEYEFTLYTNGLTLCKGNESYYLADSDGNRKATIGDIIVFTADERNNTMGSMTYETIRANQEYVLTIHLDADYLATEKTVYPIRIDPTIEINYDSSGAGAIEDITINSLQGSDGSSRSLFVGRRETYGLSRVLMKFPNLSLSGILADQITSASVELRDLICQGDEDITVECCIYNNNAPAWVEDEATSWQSIGSAYVGSLLDSHVISYGEGNVAGEQQRYSFDILTAAKAWANGTENPNKGLVFKANNTFENQIGDAIKMWCKTFSSYNRAEDYRPSLSISYTPFPDAETITLNTLNTVEISSSGVKKIYKFTPTSSGFYAFESSSIVSGDPYATLYSSNQVVVQTHDNLNGASNKNFRLVQHFSAYQTYYLVAGCHGTGTGSYSVKLTRATTPSYISALTISWGNAVTVSCNTPQKPNFYKFVPSASGEYLFYSSNRTGDPRIWIYNSSLTLIANDDDTAGNSNFRVSANLTLGQTYYIVTDHYGTQTGSYTVKTLRPANLQSGVYFLQNIGTDLYMDIDGPDAQKWVHQWTYHTSLQEQWRFAKDSDGYYTIRSEYGDKYYVGVSSSIVNTNNIKLYSSVSNSTKWKIYLTHDNELLLEPMSAKGRVLYAPNNDRGADLQLAYLSSLSAKSSWEVYTYQYEYAIEHCFDQGFSVRFSDMNSNAANIIDSYQNIVAERFFKIFGVQITPTYYTFTSSPDTCKIDKYGSVSTSTLNQDCSHLFGHLTTTKLRNDLEDGTSTTSVVIWTGHLMKDNDRSNSNSDRYSVVITPWVVSTFDKNDAEYANNVEREYIFDLMHELSHQLGAPDHYCYGVGLFGVCSNEYCDECQNDRSPRACLMSWRYDVSDLTDESMYCDDCTTMIDEHLDDHH